VVERMYSWEIGSSQSETQPVWVRRPVADTQPVYPRQTLALPQIQGRTYSAHRLSCLSTALAAGVIIAVVSGPLLFGVDQSSYAMTHFGPAAIERWSRPWFFLAVFNLAVCTIIVLVYLLRSARSISVTPSGLYLRLGLWRVRTIPWEAISGLSARYIQSNLLGLSGRLRRRVRLHLTSGQIVRLDDWVADFPELVAQVKGVLYPRWTAAISTTLAAGQWQPFGPLQLHHDGVALGQQVYGWNDLNRISIKAGQLVIETNTGLFTQIPTEKIPNLELFLQFIQSLPSIQKGVN